MKERKLFTSESVSEGHPDKLCDQIADAVLDEALRIDPLSHVACEVFATTNFILVGGEISCKGKINIKKIVKDVLKDVGYNSRTLKCDYHTVKIVNKIKQQSPDINRGVNQTNPEDLGAGDQGIMFGYATNETNNYMPLSLSIAHDLVKEATRLRHEGLFVDARPDMKSQVTIDYTNKDKLRIDTILMSVQHNPNINMDNFKKYIIDEIMIPIAKKYNLNTDFNILINPTGSFVLGGPAGDTGLTGRKIIVDTYGGAAEHGGGAFSGKDPTKVDRSGAYMARYIAKNLVAAGVADRMQIQLAYAIGINHPVSIAVNCFGTGKIDDDKILKIINKVFDTRPGIIIENFSLRKPSFKYRDITNYGHFGRNDLDLPWEKLDKVDLIKNEIIK